MGNLEETLKKKRVIDVSVNLESVDVLTNHLRGLIFSLKSEDSNLAITIFLIISCYTLGRRKKEKIS